MRRRGESGAATVSVLVLAGLLMAVAFAVAGVGGLVHAHRVAGSAADLGALAGGAAAARGVDVCGRAAAVVEANGAVLTECRVVGADVLVEAAVAPPSVLGVDRLLRARARAGPA